MNQAVAVATRRAQQTLQGFTPGQRVITVLIVVGLALGGFAFSRWAGQATYAPLYSNLSAQDASAITEKLSGQNVPYRLTDGGNTILVPDKKVYQLRLDMSADNLPSGGQSGYALLDKQGITTSDFQQHVQYQRALEGELTRTVEAIDGVQSAVVHLVIPDKSVFATESKDPTASVLVRTAPNRPLAAGQVQAIVHLVSSSVEGLSAENVTVADATGRVLNASGHSGGLEAGGDARNQQTQAYEERIGRSLQEMLDQVVGPGHAVVRVSADLDFDKTSRTTERYLQPDQKSVPLAVATTKESYKGTGTGTAGVLGPDNNGVPVGTGSGQNSYQRDQVTQQNAVGKVVEQVQAAPGAVRRMSVAVLLDERTGGTVDTARIRELVGNAAGLVASRGDTVAVDRMPFDESAAKEAAKELAQREKSQQTAGMLSLAKTVGLVVVVLVAILLLARRGRRQAVEVLGPAELAELEDARRALAARDLVLERAERPAVTAPPSDDATARRLAVHEEISSLVEQQPDEVAQLLRGWLADRRS